MNLTTYRTRDPSKISSVQTLGDSILLGKRTEPLTRVPSVTGETHIKDQTSYL